MNRRSEAPTIRATLAPPPQLAPGEVARRAVDALLACYATAATSDDREAIARQVARLTRRDHATLSDLAAAALATARAQ